MEARSDWDTWYQRGSLRFSSTGSGTNANCCLPPKKTPPSYQCGTGPARAVSAQSAAKCLSRPCHTRS
ncbi:hypothetical protein SCA03_37710 [Streptomyces cacaoi]|uniref:Uncharacterized protein n=1 Tax=Streptomyces cacaoi TaxID=1898 RepID=A0A4Y3R5L1_STRCI|nr:hypothetical protein SCA03_37710 [Streptomyces cacaoi]